MAQDRHSSFTYKTKCAALAQPSGRAEFTPAEFIRFLIATNNLHEPALNQKMGARHRGFHEIYYHTAYKLPASIADGFAQLAVNQPYQDPLFWRQQKFTVTRDANGKLRVGEAQNAFPMPRLKLSRPVTDRALPGSHQGSDFDGYENKAITLKYGAGPMVYQDFTPAEFLLFALQQQGISLPDFGNAMTIGSEPLRILFYHQQHEGKIAATHVTKLAQLATEAPYTDPLFWRQRHFRVYRNRDHGFTLDRGDALPVLDLARPMQPMHYNGTKHLSPYDRFEDKLFDLKYGSTDTPPRGTVVFNAVEYLALLLRNQDSSLETWCHIRNPGNDRHHLSMMASETLPPHYTRLLAKISQNPEQQSVDYWHHDTFAVPRGAPLPTLDLTQIQREHPKNKYVRSRINPLIYGIGQTNTPGSSQGL